MIKGTMKIELTDVNTGEKETIVEHNMVTNALRDIFKPLGHCKSPNKMYNEMAPYYQKLLGGILLFDTNIEENKDNYFPPASSKLIGCGAYGHQNNTIGTVRGGFNQSESKLNLQNRYMKYVYDFATSQANGSISCVCLTHLNGGFTSYGSNDAEHFGNYPLGVSIFDNALQYVDADYTGANTSDKYGGMTVGKSECLFLIDRGKDIAYYFCIDSGTSIRIIKRKAYLQSVSVLENPHKEKVLIEKETVTLSNPLLTEYIGYNFDHADNALYVFTYNNYYIKPKESFIVTKIELDKWSAHQYLMTNTTDVNISTNGMKACFVHDGFIYLKSYNSPYNVYKFEVGNEANAIKIKQEGISSVRGYPQMAYNGRIYYEYENDELLVLNASTDELYKVENVNIFSNSNRTFCYTPFLNEPMIYFCSCGNYSISTFFILSNYLATINNLSEPVTKTADKTMKITYIIQEQ